MSTEQARNKMRDLLRQPLDARLIWWRSLAEWLDGSSARTSVFDAYSALWDEGLVDLYIERFVNRSDAFNEQQADGRYICTRESVTPSVVRQHLAGERTIGLFALNAASKAKWVCWDFDTTGKLQVLKEFLKQRKWQSIQVSGRPDRDGHLFLLLDEPISGADVKRFGEYMLTRAGLASTDAEVFPKQEVIDNVGSAVRAPLGLNRKPEAAGCRYNFVGAPDGDALGALQWLSEQPLQKAASVRYIAERVRAVERPYKPEWTQHLSGNQRQLSTATELAKLLNATRSSNGYIAKCPAHDDNHPSLSINERNGRLLIKCFRGCTFDEVLAAAGTRSGV